MPENEDKQSRSQELAYEVENRDINDEFTVKFWLMAMVIDTTNMCSHLQRKLFDEDGIYHPLSRQLHIYRNGKKVLVLAGKAAPKIIREDSICELAVC